MGKNCRDWKIKAREEPRVGWKCAWGIGQGELAALKASGAEAGPASQLRKARTPHGGTERGCRSPGSFSWAGAVERERRRQRQRRGKRRSIADGR